jgi:hypothetical protein
MLLLRFTIGRMQSIAKVVGSTIALVMFLVAGLDM